MTDARLRGEWLVSVQFDDLSDVAWRVFTRALMFCAQNGTDGFISDKHSKYLHPEGRQPEAMEEISAAGLWTRTAGGLQLVGWSEGLGQSTAQEVEANKVNARRRAATYRDKRRKALGSGASDRRTAEGFKPEVVTGDATRDVTRDVRPHVGIGEGIGIGEGQDSGTPQDEFWPVAQIPSLEAEVVEVAF